VHPPTCSLSALDSPASAVHYGQVLQPGVKVISVSARFRLSSTSCLALVALLGMSSQAAAQEPGIAADPATPPASDATPAPPVEGAIPEGSEAVAPAPEAALPEGGEAVAPADAAALPEGGEAVAPADAAAGVPAAAPAAAPTPPVLSEPPTSSQDRGEAANGGSDKPRMFGAMFDLGVPDGTTLSFVYRPIEIARVHAGLGYNGVSPGLRLGGEYIPFGWGPTLGLAYGHFFEGDATSLATMIGGEPSEEASQLLDSVGYSFFALRAGLEFGGDRFTFFGRAGVTWISSTIHDIDTLMQPDPGSNTTVSMAEDPTLKAFVPTLQFGMIVQI
jgi:hypothetical protein